MKTVKRIFTIQVEFEAESARKLPTTREVRAAIAHSSMKEALACATNCDVAAWVDDLATDTGC